MMGAVQARGLRAWCALAGLVLVAACSSDKPAPTPLTPLEPKIAGKQVWSASVDSAKYPLIVASAKGQFFVAGTDGTVLALDAESGREVWRGDVRGTVAAGVGSDGRFAAVVTRDNEVVTLDAGKVLWRQRVPSRVVTAPLVAGERVFVMSVDRAVHAFDALDGRKLWTQARPGDALTLSQASVITAFKNTLLVAQGVRLAALDPANGTLLWETALASPRGTNEVERLADLLGPSLRLGNKVCARAFQSAVACVDASRGSLVWSRNAGGVQAVGGNEEFIVGADASDRITAWRADNGDTAWTHEKLLYRGLSGFTAVGPVAVFGDAAGWVHFHKLLDGEPQLRLSTDGSAVVGAPAVSGNTVLVVTRKGGLFAFRPY
ncbi:MAG: outer membrane protein assembly factor BamB [Rubrivivax sp.]